MNATIFRVEGCYPRRRVSHLGCGYGETLLKKLGGRFGVCRLVILRLKLKYNCIRIRKRDQIPNATCIFYFSSVFFFSNINSPEVHLRRGVTDNTIHSFHPAIISLLLLKSSRFKSIQITSSHSPNCNSNCSSNHQNHDQSTPKTIPSEAE